MRRLQSDVDAEAGPEREPLDRLRRACLAYLRFFDRNPDVVELFVQERAAFRNRRPTYFAHRDAHLAPWTGLFRSLIRRGRVRRMPVGRITDVLSAALYGVLITNYFEGRRRDPGRQARDVLDILLHGILGANTSSGRRVGKTRSRGDRQP
jgi:AcrR family transcriptional regulator